MNEHTHEYGEVKSEELANLMDVLYWLQRGKHNWNYWEAEDYEKLESEFLKLDEFIMSLQKELQEYRMASVAWLNNKRNERT